MHFVPRHLGSEVSEEGFHLPPRVNVGHPPWSPFFTTSTFSLLGDEERITGHQLITWLHQFISLFDSLIFLNLSTSYCNCNQAQQVIHLVTFDTTASPVKGSGTPYSLKLEWLHVFLEAVPGSLHTSLACPASTKYCTVPWIMHHTLFTISFRACFLFWHLAPYTQGWPLQRIRMTLALPPYY